MPPIQWYPGHMAKTRRMLETQLRRVDAVIELCDARAPLASRNPVLDRMLSGKPRVLVLNKADLADPSATQKWLSHFKAQGIEVCAFDAMHGKGREVIALLEKAVAPAVERMRLRGAVKTARAMIVGIPNVGKSSFVNRCLKRNAVEVGDRPGVTRAEKWLKLTPTLEMMDSPGMLWPRLDDQDAARMLCWLGSLPDDIQDIEDLAETLLRRLMEICPQQVMERFHLEKIEEEDEMQSYLEEACRGRGWLLSGGRLNTERGARLVLDEYRAGKMGRITLETE